MAPVAYHRDVKQDLVGAYETRPLSLQRMMTIDGLDAATPGHRTFGLVQLDVTRAQQRIAELQQSGRRVSLFAFVVASIGRALAEHPALNAIRGGRKIFRFADVDVSIAVEVDTPDGPSPVQLAIRRAQGKSPEAIYAEIEAARRSRTEAGSVGRESQRFESAMRWLLWLPRFMRVGLLRVVTRRPLLVKQWSGTTFVTSVGKFASLPGFVIPFAAGPMAVSFALGGVVDVATLEAGTVENRAMLAVTVIVNHDLVDGGPAARFVVTLQQLVESAGGLA